MFQVHDLAAGKQERKPRPMTTTAKVTVKRLAREAMAMAREAANGDMTRLETIDGNTVIVWNSPEQKAAMAAMRKNGRKNGTVVPKQRVPRQRKTRTS